MRYYANDKYRAKLRASFTANPPDGSLLVTAVPNNVPTIVVVGWNSDLETVISVQGKSGHDATTYALTGVTVLRGYGVENNLDAELPVNCLNNEEFFNQYATSLGINWIGEWDASTAYAANDGVSYKGSSYVALVDTTGDEPPLEGTWALVMSKGDTGETGPKGEKGDPGAGGVIPGGVENNIVTISADAEIQDSGKSINDIKSIDDIIDIIYPVGSIYISTVSTNPGTLFGVGTWTAFGAGKTLVGLDSGDTAFNTVEKTGGAKTHKLTVTEMPGHNHNIETTLNGAFAPGAPDRILRYGSASGSLPVSNYGSGNTGGGQAHNNLQPYIVTYFWKRIA